MTRRAAHLALALIAVVLLAAQPRDVKAASPFADWAAVFVAGDWHAHSGAPTEVFDNARRDAALAFQRAGFDPANMRQFSVRPERYPQIKPLPATGKDISEELVRLAAKAPGGCLVYFTSHGSPPGLQLGKGMFSPAAMAGVVGKACAERPTVVIVSACYSGVFLPALAGPNRMVLTAARRDRSSFGCTESDKYPYFDACLLDSLPNAADFIDLGRRARACVDKREAAEGLTPPSEPQTQIGGALRPILPFYGFERAAAR